MSEESKVIKTVGELIDALSRFHHSAPVVGTWETITEEIRVYSGEVPKLVEGSVVWTQVIMIDCDLYYQERNQEHLSEFNSQK